MGINYKQLETYEELVWALSEVLPQNLTCNDVEFVCIGTDRSTGDSLAPLVGTFLESMEYTNVHGTIDNPVHAENLSMVLRCLSDDKIVIALDACLGEKSSVGTYSVFKGPIYPGAGAGKRLPPVGDYSVTGVVNVGGIGGIMDCLVLQNTRLSVVMKMAQTIAEAIYHVLPPNSDFQEVATGVRDTYVEFV